jgi:hypothetical protein
MNYKILVVMVVAASLPPGTALAQDAAPSKVRARGGLALQLDASAGGDEITSDTVPPYTLDSNLGDGMTLSLGGFYRPSESKPWELQAFIGYKRAWFIPMAAPGYEGDISRWVVQLLANYHYENKWYFGGGLTYHANPRLGHNMGADIEFDSAVGATVEGGWSWLGMQCTYIKYGSLDASNCGVRFTWRFRKWGPLR